MKRAKVLLITAMPHELPNLGGRFGKYMEVATSHVGIGQANAATRASRLIASHKPNLVLLTGTCGSLNGAYPQGKIVAASRAINGDFDISAYDSQFRKESVGVDNGAIAGLFGDGTFLTVSYFVDEKGKKKLAGTADVVEMEAFAILKLCYEHGITAHSIKFVSDNFEGAARLDFIRFMKEAYAPREAIMEVLCRYSASEGRERLQQPGQIKYDEYAVSV